MFLKGVNQIFYLFSEYSIIYMFAYILLSRLNFIFNLKCSLIFICFISIFITIFFKNFLIKISEKLKNTLFFNFLLFYHLIIKNYIYQIFFEFFQLFENYQYKKFVYFLLGFNIALYFVTFFNYMFSYHQNLFLVLLLLNTLLHYIQNQFIFNLENIQNIFKQKEFELDYNYIQKILGITNNSNFLKKNKKLIYIQKRYVVSDKAKQKVIDNIFVSIGSLGLGGALGMAGVLSTIKVNESTVETGKENLKINAERLALEKERLAFEKRQEEIKAALEKDKNAIEKFKADLEKDKNAIEKSKVDLEKDKELHQFFKDLKEKNEKDNFILNQKIKEHNNSYFFKKDNTLDIDFLKKEIENNEKEINLVFPSVYKNNQQLNNFNSKTTSNNINEDNNLVPSMFENMFL